ncbi:MAG: hypothetical protein PSV23_06495 [Brevundimonas sp.]|uniref:hypothetical protein n=1 Tax=Brevundimonas sp. TaxID=1871086 RepID=UPI002487DE52|nr:hypothetical protein [Brevundimonas sp.]MDI1326432.1 hypothetical protein [Brevundimonas sp.]
MSTSTDNLVVLPEGKPSVRLPVARAILIGGTAAAFLDIGYAFTVWSLAGVGPEVILRAIASGVLGAPAFGGGAATAILGAVLHWLIALAMAAAYVVAGTRLPTLVRRPFVWGPLYGLVLFFIMDRIVVPLSAAPNGAPPSMAMVLGQVAAHIALVGLPIALAARHFSARSRSA